LPASVNYLSCSTSQGTCNESGGIVTANFGTVAAGGSAVLLISVQPTVAGPITNTATVRSNATDNNPANNTATVVTTVNPQGGGGQPCPDLTVTYITSATAVCRTSETTGPSCKAKAKVVVLNIGNAPAPRTLVCFYLSDDPVLDAGDTFINVYKVKILKPGHFKKRKLNKGLPPGVDPTGKFIIAVCDCGNTLIECNENNNTASSGPLVPTFKSGD
jgi:hypothetical protein